MIERNRHILVLQHADDEHLGTIDEIMRDERVSYDTIRPDIGEQVPEVLNDYHGLIIMGGPQSACEEDKHPFLKKEKQLTRDAIAKNRPIFGVCLGSQVLAESLGGRVYRSAKYEIGWRPVNLSSEIKHDHLLGHLPVMISPLHCIDDAFEVTLGAV